MQDLGDKLRLVVIAHRRIKITGQLYEELEPPTEKKGISFFFLNMYSQPFNIPYKCSFIIRYNIEILKLEN